MNKNKYVSIIIVAGILSWIAWFVVLYKLSPYNYTEVALLLFFMSLFVALACTFSILVYLLRLKFLETEFFNRLLNISLRQGILLSLIAILTLVFQLIRVLNWWTGFLLIITIVILEYYFSAKESKWIR